VMFEQAVQSFAEVGIIVCDQDALDVLGHG
jgi:hypothetical protein